MTVSKERLEAMRAKVFARRSNPLTEAVEAEPTVAPFTAEDMELSEPTSVEDFIESLRKAL